MGSLGNHWHRAMIHLFDIRDGSPVSKWPDGWGGEPVDYMAVHHVSSGCIHQLEVYLRSRLDGPTLPALLDGTTVNLKASVGDGIDRGKFIVDSLSKSVPRDMPTTTTMRLLSSGVFTLGTDAAVKADGEPKEMPGVFRQTVWERPAPPTPEPEPDPPVKRSWRDEPGML